MGCLWWGGAEATLGNYPDKLRKMTLGVVEGWQLAASRINVPSDFRGLRNKGIKMYASVHSRVEIMVGHPIIYIKFHSKT